MKVYTEDELRDMCAEKYRNAAQLKIDGAWLRTVASQWEQRAADVESMLARGDVVRASVLAANFGWAR